MAKDCIFCKIADKSIPSSLVYEDKDVCAFNDINPQAPVHVVVIPKVHIEKVSDLEPSDSDIISKVILAGKRVAREKGIEESGYRFIINCNKDAGQEVFHLHMHVIGGRRMSWPPG